MASFLRQYLFVPNLFAPHSEPVEEEKRIFTTIRKAKASDSKKCYNQNIQLLQQ